jgi:hypothetical protein
MALNDKGFSLRAAKKHGGVKMKNTKVSMKLVAAENSRQQAG